MLAAIALGSNLASLYGTPDSNLREALHRLNAFGTVTAMSSFYETDPVGLLEQPRFTNAAALLETTLGPLELLRALLALETSMGRIRTADQPPKGPRIVDLDLLLYAENRQAAEAGRALILADPDLTLPHPLLHERRFVLVPLAEIASTWQHPVLQRSVMDLLASVVGEGHVSGNGTHHPQKFAMAPGETSAAAFRDASTRP